MNKRISENNKIREEIRIINKNIEQDENTIKRFQEQKGENFFIDSQLGKLTSLNIERAKKLSELKLRALNVSKGLLDDELDKIAIDNRDKAILKSKNGRIQEIQKVSVKKIKSTESEKQYHEYLKLYNNVPGYILKNLENMPNNLGYIYNGIFLFGELVEEKNKPLTMFEKLSDGVLYIHEFDKREHRIYIKYGQEKKQLISSKKRKNLLSRNL